jgi:hypothetical protein
LALFYPFSELVTSAAQPAANQLTFGAVQPWVIPGAGIVDETAPRATTSTAGALTVNTVPNATTVTMSANAFVPVNSGDRILFLSYPFAATQSAQTNANSPTLNVASVPLGVAAGMGIVDYTTPGAIPLGTTVTPNTATSLTLSNNTAQAIPAGNSIGFIAPTPSHVNMQRRWKYFLRNELLSSCHAAIKDAILEAVVNTDVARIAFDVIEGTNPIVHTAIESDAVDPVGFGALGNIYMRIVLETQATKAGQATPPIPLDSQ